MIKYEIKKNIHISFILLFVFVIVLEFISIQMGTSSIDMQNQDEKYYLEYTKKWNGVLTKTKEDEINSEKEYIDTTISISDEKKDDYVKNKIAKEEYDKYLEELSYCRYRSQAFEKFYEDYQYVKMEGNKGRTKAKPEIFYKDYWKIALSPDGFDYFAAILMAFFSISIGFIERDSLMTLILYSSEKGRYDILKNKLKTGGIIVGIMALIISMEKIIIYYKIGYFPNATASISSLDYFSGTCLSLPIWGIVFLALIINVTAHIIISQILILLAYIISKKMTEIVVVVVGFFGLETIKNLMPVAYAYMPGSILNVFNIFRYGTKGGNIFVQVLLIASVIIFYIIIKEILQLMTRRKLKF